MESMESVCFKTENKKQSSWLKARKCKKNAKKLKEKLDFCRQWLRACDGCAAASCCSAAALVRLCVETW